MKRATGVLLLAAAMAIAARPAAAAENNLQRSLPRIQRLVPAPPGFRDACQRYAWLCDSGAGAHGRAFTAAELLGLARRINRRVNRTVSQVTDAENYGRADYWTLPTGGSGDCEDFVLEKFRRLLAAGVPARALSVAVALDAEGENHAVLVLHHPDGDYVLDNLSARVRLWNETGYRFLAMQQPGERLSWQVVAGRPRSSPVLAQY